MINANTQNSLTIISVNQFLAQISYSSLICEHEESITVEGRAQPLQ